MRFLFFEIRWCACTERSRSRASANWEK